jgi:hypothetical protein
MNRTLVAPAVAASAPAPLGIAGVSLAWCLRTAGHLTLAGLPVLAITADVLGWVPLRVIAVDVLLPLTVALTLVVIVRPHPSESVLAAGFVTGLVACAAYDAFRLPTIYEFHLWGDFFGAVGGWATNEPSNFLVGYLWRYLGDGGGIAVTFFAVAATIGLHRRSRRQVMVAAIAFGVCPVWSGLVLTDLLAQPGHELFPLTAVTLTLSLVGHLIYGAGLGVGFWLSRDLVASRWPYGGSL